MKMTDYSAVHLKECKH